MIDIQNFTQLLAQNLAKYLALVVRVLNFHLNQSQLPFGIYKVHYQQGTDPLFHNGSAAMFISRKKLSNRVIEPRDGNFVFVCRLFSRGVIFTRARISLALLSLRKNGDYS